MAEFIKRSNADLSQQINDMHLRLDDKFTKEIAEVKKDINNIVNRQINMEDKLEKMDRQMHLTDLYQ